MKKLITLLAILSANNLSAQDCDTVVKFTNNLERNSNFKGNVCFEASGDTAVISNSSNWNSWDELSFSTENSIFIIDQNINMNKDKTVHFKTKEGTIIVKKVNMSGDAVLKVSNNIIIKELGCNNKGNVIYLSGYSVNINGKYYSVGDTVVTNSSSNYAVIVGDKPFSILLKSFTLDDEYLKWQTSATVMVELQGSNNGAQFYTIAHTTDNQYKINNIYSFYRLKINDYTSKIVKVNTIITENMKAVYYDNLGRKYDNIDFAPSGLYYKVYNNVIQKIIK